MKNYLRNMRKNKNVDWDATAFFERLTSTNRLALSHDAKFCRVSGLDGFNEYLGRLQSAKLVVAASDTSSGALITDGNTPHHDRVKLFLLAMRHKEDDMPARQRALDILRELFRQFMSVLMLEKVRLEQDCLYIDDAVSFNEIDQYFAAGMACAYFQLKVTTYSDLRYNPEEWLDP